MFSFLKDSGIMRNSPNFKHFKYGSYFCICLVLINFSDFIVRIFKQELLLRSFSGTITWLPDLIYNRKKLQQELHCKIKFMGLEKHSTHLTFIMPYGKTNTPSVIIALTCFTFWLIEKWSKIVQVTKHIYWEKIHGEGSDCWVSWRYQLK